LAAEADALAPTPWAASRGAVKMPKHKVAVKSHSTRSAPRAALSTGFPAEGFPARGLGEAAHARRDRGLGGDEGIGERTAGRGSGAE